MDPNATKNPPPFNPHPPASEPVFPLPETGRSETSPEGVEVSEPVEPEPKIALSEWFQQDRTLKRSELCLAAMLKGWAPESDLDEILLTKTELDALIRDTRIQFRQICNSHGIVDTKKAYIIPSEGLLVAFICKRPTQAAIERVMQALFSDEPAVKAGAHKTLFNDCVLWPDAPKRTALFNDYAGMQHTLGGVLHQKSTGAKEALEKKR